MVIINMPIPKTCVDCPCSHWVEGGEWEGMLMCNAIERNVITQKKGGDATEKSLVDEYLGERPPSCPILGEIKGFTVAKE